MKIHVSKVVVLILFFMGIFFTCKKNDVLDSTSGTITGEWKWIKTYTGGAPGDMNPLTPKNTGITESIVFTKDSSWSKIKNKMEVESGEKFTIGHGVYITGGPSWVDPTEWVGYTYEYDSILYIKNGIPIGTDYFKIEENNLSFSGSFKGATGGSKWFIRIK